MPARKKERLNKEETSIAIVGSGPGALSAALALQQEGFRNITIYERDEHFSSRKDGYGLTLTYNPSMTSPLTKLGLLEKLARLDCPSRSHYIFDTRGKVLGYFGNAFSKSSSRGYGQRGNLRVPRQVLRRVMMDTLIERDVDHKVRIEWNKRLTGYSDIKSPHQTRLEFEDGSTATADILIGADGVKSTVMKNILKEVKECTNYLGIMIVIGITHDFYHPLLDERGFYTVDGNHRLFTMPYEGSKVTDLIEKGIPISDHSSDLNRTRRYMWQLSYNLPYEEAIKISKEGPHSLLHDVLRRTKGWHEPVEEMFRTTPIETIWGTPLVDRLPTAVKDKMDKLYNRSKGMKTRVITLGDAIHAMSPFKGQGCNQALLDGPLLSSWLGKSSIDSAITGFIREMVQRTSKKVKASRDAAKILHSISVFDDVQEFAGVKTNDVQKLIDVLHKRNIGARLGVELDNKIEEVIRELGVSDQNFNDVIPSCDKQKDLALDLSRTANLEGIRKLSIDSPDAIRLAIDSLTGETCLHLAAKAKCIDTCKWLISEAFLDYRVLDYKKRSPLHSAVIGGDVHVIELFAKLSKTDANCWKKDADGNTPLVLLSSETIQNDYLYRMLVRHDPSEEKIHTSK